MTAEQNNSNGREVFEMGAVKGLRFYKEPAFKHYFVSIVYR